MECPKCGKPMLDVRAQKQNPKAPDFQCPDANCLNDKGYRTGAWLPKPRGGPSVQGYNQTTQPEASQAPQNGSGRDQKLVALYWDCYDEVLAGLKKRSIRDGFNDEHIAACVATQYIARSKGI